MKADQTHGPVHSRQGSDEQAALVDEVARAVVAVDGVIGLHGGMFGEVATYLPGRRVPGIRMLPDGSAEVHVIVDWGASALATAYAVRRAAAAIVGGRVDVTIGDIAADNVG